MRLYHSPGCITGTGAIIWLPQCPWSNPEGYRKINLYQSTAKHNQMRALCIIIGTNSVWWSYYLLQCSTMEHAKNCCALMERFLWHTKVFCCKIITYSYHNGLKPFPFMSSLFRKSVNSNKCYWDISIHLANSAGPFIIHQSIVLAHLWSDIKSWNRVYPFCMWCTDSLSTKPTVIVFCMYTKTIMTSTFKVLRS